MCSCRSNKIPGNEERNKKIDIFLPCDEIVALSVPLHVASASNYLPRILVTISFASRTSYQVPYLERLAAIIKSETNRFKSKLGYFFIVYVGRIREN
jgi:hypothetical protein